MNPDSIHDVAAHVSPLAANVTRKVVSGLDYIGMFWFTRVSYPLGEIVHADAEVVNAGHGEDVVDVVNGALVFQ